jgi:hypothetical protein
VTGITATHSAGVDVWQMQTFAEPTYYTIFSSKLYLNCGVQSTYAGKNIYISYYRKPTAINSDTDTLNIPDFSIYHYYLAWKILLYKSNGQATNESELMYKKFIDRKENLKYMDRVGQYTFMKPRINSTGRYPIQELRTSFVRTI